jgi:hypothetical protein
MSIWWTGSGARLINQMTETEIISNYSNTRSNFWSRSGSSSESNETTVSIYSYTMQKCCNMLHIFYLWTSQKVYRRTSANYCSLFLSRSRPDFSKRQDLDPPLDIFYGNCLLKMVIEIYLWTKKLKYSQETVCEICIVQ